MRLSRLVAAGCAVAAITPVLLPSAEATAAGSAQRVVYVADASGSDGAFGLYTAPNFGDPPTTVIAENGKVDVLQAKLSPDGTQIAALVDSAGTGLYSLQVMNVDGGHRRTVLASTGSTFVLGLSWAPDSASLVFGQVSGTSAKLRRYTNGTGAIADVANSNDLADPAVAADGRIAAVNGNGELVVLDPASASGPSKTGAAAKPDFSDFIESPAWSPDGTALAYVDDLSTQTVFTSVLNVITLTAGVWSSPQVVAPSSSDGKTWFSEYPTFSAGDTIWFDRIDTTTPTGAQDIVTATRGASGWTLAPTTTQADDGSISFGALDTTAPAAPTLLPFTLAGTTTYLKWTATDVDVSKLKVHRVGSDGLTADFFAPTSPFADKTTKLGVTYTYTAKAVDGVGNTSTTDSAARSVTAAGTKVAVSNPTSLTSAKLPFLVSWGVAGNKGVTYTAQYAPYGSAVKTFKAGTTAANGAFTSPAAGQTYSFRAIVQDTHGNSSAWSGWSKAVVPFDQSKGKFSTSPSWSTARSTADWLGSIKTTAHNKATATFTLTSRGVQIIGDKFPKGAKFAVYVGKTYKGTFSTAASTTKHRQVLYKASFPSLASRTIKIVAVVASGKTLKIDGVAAPK